MDTRFLLGWWNILKLTVMMVRTNLWIYLTPVNSTLLLGQLYVYEWYLNNAIKIIYAKKLLLGP